MELTVIPHFLPLLSSNSINLFWSFPVHRKYRQMRIDEKYERERLTRRGLRARDLLPPR